MSDTTATIPADDGDIRRMSFEEALAALERIVSDLERGDVPLEHSIRIYERGEKLKSHCDRLLSAAEDKVEKIKLSRAGKPTDVEPLDPA
ncbi:exodeoxyribonuclease VII small subunit [Aureimonas sp. ME7]|uniref:exodeoxyribonuclease VII small subunit n=1 Tax=Aureimonas sp. ME7 TaxID=2744252 RepID=UPI0015F7043C|nr:exodeoxyribonuclease VII small subunit [Aureimonas sp. ME7]